MLLPVLSEWGGIQVLKVTPVICCDKEVRGLMCWDWPGMLQWSHNTHIITRNLNTSQVSRDKPGPVAPVARTLLTVWPSRWSSSWNWFPLIIIRHIFGKMQKQTSQVLEARRLLRGEAFKCKYIWLSNCDSREQADHVGWCPNVRPGSLRVYPGTLIGHQLSMLAYDWPVVTCADQAEPG